MLKKKNLFKYLYKKYKRSKFKKFIKENYIEVTVLVSILGSIIIPISIKFLDNLEMKKTSQIPPTVVQEVYFIDNNSFLKLEKIK